MSIITTKQLRDNMSQVILDLKQGKAIQLSYRHKVIGTLQPVDIPSQALQRGSAAAIRQGLQKLHTLAVPDSIKQDTHSFKEQIAQYRNQKYEV